MDLALSDALLSPPDHAVPRPYAADPLLLLPFASAWATLAPRERERERQLRERERQLLLGRLSPRPPAPRARPLPRPPSLPAPRRPARLVTPQQALTRMPEGRAAIGLW